MTQLDRQNICMYTWTFQEHLKGGNGSFVNLEMRISDQYYIV